MAIQQTGTPPNTRRLGIFPDPIRKFFIVFMIILFLIGGIIGIIGVWKNWGIVSNMLFMIFAVASVILGILTFWPSNKSNEASAVSPRQFLFESIIRLRLGQQGATQQVPSFSNESGDQEPIPNTNATKAQQQPSKNMQKMPTGNSPVSPVRRDESPLSYAEQRTNGAGEIGKKPENLGTHKEKRDAVKQDLEEPLPNTLRGCVEAVQWNVDQAYDLLDPEVDISPADKAKAVRSLETAKKDIEHLERLLQENPSHPKYGSIIDQARIITDQVDRYLLPYITPPALKHENYQKRFTVLQNALTKLDTLIPE